MMLADYAPVLSRLDRLRLRSDVRGVARCPVHEDRTPSLSLWIGRDGRLMIGCWGGCPKCEILRALALRWADLFPPRDSRPRRLLPMKEIAAYPYCDEFGEVLYEVVRCEPKTFRQRRPARPGDDPEKVSEGGWVWNLDGCPRVLYRLPEIIEADPSRWLCVVAGEKDCESLRSIGVLATTNVCGESAGWLPEYTQALAGRNVVLVPDNDPPGWRHMAEVGWHLLPRAAAVKLLRLPGLAFKQDATDWIEAQNGASPDAIKKLLWGLVEAAPLL